MSLHRRAAKRDTAEAEIVQALRAYGFSVEPLSKAGVPDLLIGRRETTRVAEVKTSNKPLNTLQRAWWDAWRGNREIILRSVEDVAKLAREWR